MTILRSIKRESGSKLKKTCISEKKNIFREKKHEKKNIFREKKRFLSQKKNAI